MTYLGHVKFCMFKEGQGRGAVCADLALSWTAGMSSTLEMVTMSKSTSMRAVIESAMDYADSNRQVLHAETGLARRGAFQAAGALHMPHWLMWLRTHLPLESTLDDLGPELLASLQTQSHVISKSGQLNCRLPCFCSSRTKSPTCR